MKKEYSPMVQQAIAFATAAHEGQMRKGKDVPYIVHPLEALDIVSTMTEDEDVLCAAVLHDVLEDTAHTEEEIREQFGARVAALVLSESEDKQKDLPATDTWRARKQATINHLKHADPETRMICLGDKLANARDIVKDYKKIGDKLWERFNASPADIAWYYSSIVTVLYDDFCDTDAWRKLSDCLTEPAFLCGLNAMGEEQEQQEKEKLEKYLPELLAADIKEYAEDPSEEGAVDILTDFLRLMTEDIAVSVPVSLKTDEDGDPTFEPIAVSRKDRYALVILTKPDRHFDVFANMHIRRLIGTVCQDEDLTGIVIDPFDGNFVLSRDLLLSAVDLFKKGYDDAQEEFAEDNDKKSKWDKTLGTEGGVSFAVDCPRPMTEEAFEGIRAAIAALVDRAYEHVTVSFRNFLRHDEVLFIQTARNTEQPEEEKKYHVEVAFDMNDFRQEKPLILGTDGMTAEETIDFFHEICVKGTRTDDIRCIQNFRDLG